ncbi:MAG: acyl--CoA ligase [Oligoflexia bacterium]|nr:acyl--CoA ligase [Oligoflexia bacterium]
MHQLPPSPANSVLDAWLAWCAAAPSGPVLVDSRDQSAFSMEELDLLVRRAAGWLRAQGLRPSQRFVVVGQAEIEVLVVIYGAMLSGLVPVILHPGSPQAWIDQVAAEVGASLCLVGTGVQGSVGRPSLREARFSSALACADPLVSLPLLDPDAEAVVLFSSGSTGPAHGVVLSHRALVAGVRRLQPLAPVEPGSRVGLPALIHTVTGVRMALLGAALTHTTTVLLPPQGSPAELLAACATHRIALLHSGPGLVRICSLAPHRFAGLCGATLHTVVAGGGGLGTETRQRFADGLGLRLVHTYGMTETGGLCAAATVTPGSTAVAGMGRPVVPVQVVDRHQEPVPVGVLGRLLLAPDPPMLYTLSGVRPVAREGRLWVDSGDKGMIDDQGVLHVQGRADRTFVTAAGENVQLEHLEAHIRECCGAEVVAFELTPPRRAPLLGVVVERDQLGELWLARVQQALRQRLPEHALPSLWRATPTLPRLPGGKVDLIAARRLLEARW